MGCISEWGLSVNRNTFVSGMHHHAIGLARCTLHIHIKNVRSFYQKSKFHFSVVNAYHFECYHLIFFLQKTNMSIVLSHYICVH